jgi:hypothetical protein
MLDACETRHYSGPSHGLLLGMGKDQSASGGSFPEACAYALKPCV